MSDLDAFLAPISDEDPCGPDLDLEGDADFMMTTARIEGLLPSEYFKFDRATIDVASERAALRGLLERSRDLRIVLLLAKLECLFGNFNGFADAIDLMTQLVETRWEGVHPRGEGGEYVMRANAVEALEDQPHILLPLQSFMLVDDRRAGQLTYRGYLLAKGDLRPRTVERPDGTGTEDVPQIGAVEKTLDAAPIEALVALRDRILGIGTSTERLAKAFLEGSDSSVILRFEKLGPLLRNMAALLEETIQRRDPSLARSASTTASAPEIGGDSEGTTAPTTGALAFDGHPSLRRALRSVEAYYAAKEPSSPVRLLVTQARALIGQPFPAVLRILFPNHAEQAVVRLGTAQPFDVLIDRLAVEGGEESAWADDETADAVESRLAAISTMQSVAAYLRKVEPSSPVPMLLDRALALAERGFLELVGQMLPAAAFIERETS